MFSGEGGTGKTILTLQLMCSTVLGRDWIGSVPSRGR
jgi:RecA-family ATPase